MVKYLGIKNKKLKKCWEKMQRVISFVLIFSLTASWAYGIIPGLEKFSPETKTAEAAGNTKIRQEINIIDGYVGAVSGSYATSSAIINISPGKYTSPTYYFEVVASTSASISSNIYLKSPSGSTTATVAIPSGTTSYARLRSSAFSLSENFADLGQAATNWRGISVDSSNHNVYGAVYNGDIYKQTAGTGNFAALGQTTRNWYDVSADSSNHNVYAIVYGGDIYKQTGGTGNFAALSQIARGWGGISVDSSNQNVYATDYDNGDIYKQTGGTGDFVALSQTARNWRGISVDSSNHNVYAVDASDIYKQTGGTGDFVALGQTGKTWYDVSVDSSNQNVYAVTFGGDIYKQTGGTGDFVALGQTARYWYGISVDSSNQNVYAFESNGNIYETNSSYVAVIGNESGATKGIIAARVIALQDATSLTNTQTQIEIGNQESAKNNTSTAALAYPKYWYYDSNKWDGSPIFYAEATYKLTPGYVSSSTTYSMAGTYTVAIPSDTYATSTLVELWGGGGAGGAATANPGAGSGGAGGAYAMSRINGLSGNKTLLVAATTVGGANVSGSRGATSTWETNVVIAGGGAGGGKDAAASTTGDTTGSVGDIKNAGGGGGRGVTTAYGAGGGGGAGSTGAGGNSTGAGVAGTGTSVGGGGGGDKQTTYNNIGNAGTQAGGGGGGGYTNKVSNQAGGTGAAGMAKITHNVTATTTKIDIALEEDDGNFGNWIFKKMIITGGTDTAATRVRSASFTPTTGKNYRLVASTTPQSGAVGYSFDIYSAKIIVDQTSPTKLQPQYLINNTATSTLGLAKAITLYDPAEWGNVSTTFIHQIDSSTDTNDQAKLQSNVTGVAADITNSTATGANRATSTVAGMTMPTGTETQREIGDYVLNAPIYSSRILVDVGPPAITVDLSGIVYATEGGSNIGIGKTVNVYKNGATLIGTDTTDASGAWSATLSPIPVSGDIVTVYVDGDAIDANMVLVSDGATKTNIDLYGGTLVVRKDTVGGSITNANLHTGAIYGEADMIYATSTSNAITLNSNAELHVWTGHTYTAGGTLTTQGTGDLHIDDNSIATLDTATNAVADSITIDTGATLNINSATTVGGDISVAGTLSGTGNLTVSGGDVTGNGTINMTSGVFTLDGTGLFGGSTNWSFNELKFGDGTGVATTTSTGANQITSATTTIAANQKLDAGVSKTWNLTASYDPFQILGTFFASSSSFVYQGINNATVTPTTYFNLEISPPSGSPTYMANGGGSSDWYSTGGTWTYRKAITIDKTKVPNTDQTDFPVLIDLTDSGLQANAQSDGDDILFTSSNGTTKLAHEIELYTTATGRLTAWVKVPTLSTSADTVIYMYYGNGSATSQQDVVNVWDANYKAVWHLNETSGTTVYDSTSNNNDFTKYDASNPASGTGKIGTGLVGDNSNDTMNLASEVNFGSTVTISAWIQLPSASWRGTVPLKSATNYYLGTFEAGVGDPYTDPAQRNLGFKAGWGDYKWPGITLGSLRYFVITSTNPARIAYENGVSLGTTNDASGRDFMVGTSDFQYGTVDEMRISNIVRSADWIATEYNNQSATSTFYKSIGIQETSGPGSLTVNNNFTLGGAGNVTLDANTKDPNIDINGNLTIGSGDTFSASNSSSLVITGNISNSGTFTHNNGTITLDTSTTAIISSTANMSFYNLTVATPGKTIQFGKHTTNVPTFSFDNLFTITGLDGNPIFIQSDTSGDQWLVDFNVVQTAISNISIKDSACAVGSLSVSYNHTNSSRGNNGTCWNITNKGASGDSQVTSVEQGTGWGILRTSWTTRGSNGGGVEGGGGGGTLQGDGVPGGGGGSTP